MKKLALLTTLSLLLALPCHAIELTQFTASLTNKGVLQFSTKYSGTDSSCTVIIRGDEDPENLTGGQALTAFQVISPALSWQTALKRKAKSNVYVIAQLVCSEGVTESEAVLLKTKKVKSKKKISTAKWLKKVAKKLSH